MALTTHVHIFYMFKVTLGRSQEVLTPRDVVAPGLRWHIYVSLRVFGELPLPAESGDLGFGL